MARLKILCIHGYRQNAQTFREKTGALRKQLKNTAEFVYISAPLCVKEEVAEGNNASASDDPRCWWFSNVHAKHFDAHQECDKSLGLDESITCVREAVKMLGPFDGILGFSQGAAFAIMLCSLQEQKLEEFNFRFAIFISGFRSKCKEHESFYAGTLQIPSLHVYGLKDKVISESMSKDVFPLFSDLHYVVHKYGHYVPAASAHKQGYQEFLDQFL